MDNTNKEKIYLGFVPNDKKELVRKNKCKYDFEKHRWFTTDLNNKMIKNFERIEINFWSLINDLGLTYDKEKKHGIAIKQTKK